MYRDEWMTVYWFLLLVAAGAFFFLSVGLLAVETTQTDFDTRTTIQQKP